MAMEHQICQCKSSVQSFEYFLNGCGSVDAEAEVSLGHLSSENPMIELNMGIYNSELKTIAASFLHGYLIEQFKTEKPVVPVDSVSKKVVETFGVGYLMPPS